jgi:hypothetical protein
MSDTPDEHSAWHDWWHGGANRSFTELLAAHGCDHRYGPPLLARLRDGATIVELQDVVSRLRQEHGDPASAGTDHSLAVRLAMWWDTNRPFEDGPAANGA